MLKCPLCDKPLTKRDSNSWLCECGESIPFGLEVDSSENCAECPVLYCPKRKRPQSSLIDKSTV